MDDKKTRFDRAYRDNKDAVYRLCRAYLGPQAEAEDLFQEIFLRVWQHLDNFRGESAIGTWVYRIAINAALLYRKREAKRKERTISDMPELPAEQSQQAETEARILQLQKAISSLKPLERLLIGMVLEGFKYAEIGESLGLTANNVAVKVNRIKTILKQKMEASHE